MIYLASPYSHTDPDIREQRFLAARDATIRLIKRGHFIFSPIVYSHQMSETIGVEFTHWKYFDANFVKKADQFWVLKLDGWSISKGVDAEMVIAFEAKKPIFMVNPLDLIPKVYTSGQS